MKLDRNNLNDNAPENVHATFCSSAVNTKSPTITNKMLCTWYPLFPRTACVASYISSGIHSECHRRMHTKTRDGGRQWLAYLKSSNPSFYQCVCALFARSRRTHHHHRAPSSAPLSPPPTWLFIFYSVDEREKERPRMRAYIANCMHTTQLTLTQSLWRAKHMHQTDVRTVVLRGMHRHTRSHIHRESALFALATTIFPAPDMLLYSLCMYARLGSSVCSTHSWPANMYLYCIPMYFVVIVIV